MNKPDWKDAPVFAKWLAQDADGRWWWHSTRPMLDDDFEWYGSTKFRLAGNTENHDSFRDSLEARPSC